MAWRYFAVAAPVVAMMTVLLCQFIDLVHAEHLLHRAAAASAQEATLPCATYASVVAATERVLRPTRMAGVTDVPMIKINGQSNLHSTFDLLKSGDCVQVTLGACATDAAPDMLRAIGLSLAGRKLRVTAAFVKP